MLTISPDNTHQTVFITFEVTHGICQYVLDLLFFFFKQKTAYEILRSDWSSDCALPICRGRPRSRVNGRPLTHPNPGTGTGVPFAAASRGFRMHHSPETGLDRTFAARRARISARQPLLRPGDGVFVGRKRRPPFRTRTGSSHFVTTQVARLTDDSASTLPGAGQSTQIALSWISAAGSPRRRWRPRRRWARPAGV